MEAICGLPGLQVSGLTAMPVPNKSAWTDTTAWAKGSPAMMICLADGRFFAGELFPDDPSAATESSCRLTNPESCR